DIRKTQGVIQKNVSTSELIDWFNILKQFPEEEALAKLNGTLPFSGVLLKSWEAHQRYMTQTKG
ncbi:MAG: MoxR family ATPase, partial [Cyanobacteria bacterium J06632_3]